MTELKKKKEKNGIMKCFSMAEEGFIECFYIIYAMIVRCWQVPDKL